jgi:hypothetical protein
MIFSDTWAHMAGAIRSTSLKVLHDWERMVIRWSMKHEPDGLSLRTKNLLDDIDRVTCMIEDDPCDYGWEEQWGEEIELIGDTMNRMGIVA